MRDHLKPADYWQEAQTANATMRSYLLASLEKKTATLDPKAAISANSLLMARFEKCLLDYSSGQPLAGIANEAIALLCEWYPDYMETNPPGSPMAIQRPAYNRINRFFSLLILCNPPTAKAERFVDAYEMWDFTTPPAPGHIDRICEAMASYLVPERTSQEADGVNWADAYGELWLAIAPETSAASRVEHLTSFLDEWYDKMASEMAAQTGTHKQKDPNYVGYWCLEAAAASVMVDIDDTSFRDHAYYPAEWADWARSARD